MVKAEAEALAIVGEHMLVDLDGRWCIRTEVYTEDDSLTVSTVELMQVPDFDLWQGKPYETCIFHASGESDVVARYATKAEAIDAHAEWVAHYS